MDACSPLSVLVTAAAPRRLPSLRPSLPFVVAAGRAVLVASPPPPLSLPRRGRRPRRSSSVSSDSLLRPSALAGLSARIGARLPAVGSFSPPWFLFLSFSFVALPAVGISTSYWAQLESVHSAWASAGTQAKTTRARAERSERESRAERRGRWRGLRIPRKVKGMDGVCATPPPARPLRRPRSPARPLIALSLRSLVVSVEFLIAQTGQRRQRSVLARFRKCAHNGGSHRVPVPPIQSRKHLSGGCLPPLPVDQAVPIESAASTATATRIGITGEDRRRRACVIGAWAVPAGAARPFGRVPGDRDRRRSRRRGGAACRVCRRRLPGPTACFSCLRLRIRLRFAGIPLPRARMGFIR